ncbi:MAG: type II secretion system GspH family protein [Chitinophagaceae bacterium]|nr:type II secretion system GspH family protein [Chitinophagaceae bacterium]
MNKKNKINKGFTLIELMLVISILTFITSIILVSFKSSREKARYAKIASDFEQLAKAAELYRLNYDTYPTGTGETNGSVGSDSMPDTFKTIVSRMPIPPCNSWRYEMISTATNTLITAEKMGVGAGAINPVNYLCITSSDGCKSLESTMSMTEIKNYPNKAITCNEQ